MLKIKPFDNRESFRNVKKEESYSLYFSPGNSVYFSSLRTAYAFISVVSEFMQENSVLLSTLALPFRNLLGNPKLNSRKQINRHRKTIELINDFDNNIFLVNKSYLDAVELYRVINAVNNAISCLFELSEINQEAHPEINSQHCKIIKSIYQNYNKIINEIEKYKTDKSISIFTIKP